MSMSLSEKTVVNGYLFLPKVLVWSEPISPSLYLSLKICSLFPEKKETFPFMLISKNLLILRLNSFYL